MERNAQCMMHGTGTLAPGTHLLFAQDDRASHR